MARPTKYTKALADRICVRLADGESLRSICQAKTMPSKTTVFRWLQDERHDIFRDQYARAREWQSESHMDEALEMAVEESLDPSTDQPAAPFVQRARLLFDVRMSVAERLSPKKYGKLVGKDDGDGVVDIATSLAEIAGRLPG